jgi:acyl-CoA synthetase (AMP-forming)/AMP-acid ligase II
MGEVGVAFVVARPGRREPTLRDVHEFASDRLAAYKLPAELRIVTSLPLTSMDKVDRRALASRFSF